MNQLAVQDDVVRQLRGRGDQLGKAGREVGAVPGAQQRLLLIVREQDAEAVPLQLRRPACRQRESVDRLGKPASTSASVTRDSRGNLADDLAAH
ncbi:hypothetical protein GCM10010361_14790 [Streptomyces olivaceiscleroticus]|uniref:Uncharacterized protein n=1 Tax=Streptomyces olivaceiscleroticus TaxID=68245 RepID=A0ABN0ZMR3_9ACTN